MGAELPSLQSTVIDGGYCVGCGACAAASGANRKMQWRGDRYHPVISGGRGEDPDGPEARVCPFSDASLDEDRIGKLFFSEANDDPHIGRHLAVYAGHAKSGDYRARGSSGGGVSWFLNEALSSGAVDAVAHSKPDPGTGPLFSYGVSRSVEGLAEGAKSHYFPSEISQVIAAIRETEGRYAFVGVPCVIRAVRNLMLSEPVLKERIVLLVGLFCGHMKSAYFSEALGWEAGFAPRNLRAVDFRVKYAGQPASIYGYSASGLGADGTTTTVAGAMRDTLVYDWGVGWFKLKPCDYCDDVVAECADISFGDAWLPEYAKDWQGKNVIVARSELARSLLENGAERGDLYLDPLEAGRVVESQKSGFAHRREGLAYRLWLSRKHGKWAPRKRVVPGWRHLSFSRRRVLELRMELAAASARHFEMARQADDYALFLEAMRALLMRYRFWNLSPRGKLRFALTFPLRSARKIIASVLPVRPAQGGAAGRRPGSKAHFVPAFRSGGSDGE